MAIDLFVNFERHSNNPIFYRTTSPLRQTSLTLRLSDLSLPEDGSLGTTLSAKYTFNNLDPAIYISGQLWYPDRDDNFVLPLDFETIAPCVCAIRVDVYKDGIVDEPFTTFSMSGVFVDRMPTADFVAYPTLYINPITGEHAQINSSNYLLSSKGLYFYGEGHTGVVNLSCNVPNTQGTPLWLIGNNPIDLIEDISTRESVYKVTTDSVPDFETLTETTISSKPNFVPFVDIAAGADHSFFMKYDRTIWGYGLNDSGQLGNGTYNTSSSLTATQVSITENVVEIAAGKEHSLFLLDDGTVWGIGGNAVGQLGEEVINTTNLPVQVAGIEDVANVAAGGYHSLFLKNDGSVWGCGLNDTNQLGTGSTEISSYMTPFLLVSSYDFTKISGSVNYSLFLKSDQTVWGCGLNYYSQMGTEATEISSFSTITQLTGIEDVVDMKAGPYHSLFLKNDGTVWSCGLNDVGQLGVSTEENYSSTFVQVNSGTDAVQIAAGGSHNLFLKTDGTVWSWGSNNKGQLGVETTDYYTVSAIPINISGVTKIVAGEDYSLFLKDDQSAISCGSNNYGKLGNIEITNIPYTTELIEVAIEYHQVTSISSTIKPTVKMLGTTVDIPTSIDEVRSIPINVWITTSSITTAGPIITYTDAGNAEYYPFFNSSIDINGNQTNTLVKDNIEVKTYPKITQAKLLQSPFAISPEYDFFDTYTYVLPMDYTFETFTAKTLTAPVYSNIVEEKFLGTQWEISADPQQNSTIIPWSFTTPFLPKYKNYKFKLAYTNDTNELFLPFYRLSPEYPTTVTITVSSFRSIRINLNTDWDEQLTVVVDKITTTFDPLPHLRLHTPKYFNIIGEKVTFSIAKVPKPPLRIDKVTLTSSKSLDTLVLTHENPTGTMTFDTLGLVDIQSVGTIRDVYTRKNYPSTYLYNDIIEIVKEYNQVPDENSFYTKDTPYTLPYNEYPRLSPNEWAIADTVNSIIEKFYTTLETLQQKSSPYFKKDKFYSYLGLKPKKSIVDKSRMAVTWADLDCSGSLVVEKSAKWNYFESTTFDCLTSTWEQQTAEDVVVRDPSGLQKHCIKWTWFWRRAGMSDLDVTWKQTKSSEEYPKKWRYEKCENDESVNNCNRTDWKVVTIDTDAFPIPSSKTNEFCPIIDVDVIPNTKQIAIAYATEVHLVDNNYSCTHRARVSFADDSFNFQQIVALATTSEGMVVVLDGVIPRISIFRVYKNNLLLDTAWGSYGRIDSLQGFNNPTDIHIDKYDFIWIADYGNKCLKKFTTNGKPIATITNSYLDVNPPLSVCLDSQDNIHCLTNGGIFVFDLYGEYLHQYEIKEEMVDVNKINTSFNREMIYVTYKYGVAKYFRNGVFSHYVMKDELCGDGMTLEGFNSLYQDSFANLYITAGDKILNIQDLQYMQQLKSAISPELYWKLSDLKIHKEEYIQAWVYLKSFHRLWDNIELLRNSLYYVVGNECKSYVAPVYAKEDLIIGQNELVTNAVINRLSEQLWRNTESLINYFDPNCEK